MQELFQSPTFIFATVAFVLAVVPLALWGAIYYKKDPVDRKYAIFVTLLGMLSVLPIIGFQNIFQRYPVFDVFQKLQSLSKEMWIGYLLTFLIVGMLEEWVKHYVVVILEKYRPYWRDIADGIEFSVLAAVGFAFVENIAYFVGIVSSGGYGALFIPFIFRSLFSVFAHTLFSGVYGYHVALAHFSKKWLDHKSVRAKRKMWVVRSAITLLKIKAVNIFVRIVFVLKGLLTAGFLLHLYSISIWANPRESMLFKFGALVGILALIGVLWYTIWHFVRHLQRIDDDEVFAEEERLEGLFLAIVLHTIFNFILWLEMTWLIPTYLFAGYLWISWELKRQENWLDLRDGKTGLVEGWSRRKISG